MTILIDMDDTMEGFLKVWTEFLHVKHGVNVSKEDIKLENKEFQDLIGSLND